MDVDDWNHELVGPVEESAWGLDERRTRDCYHFAKAFLFQSGVVGLSASTETYAATEEGDPQATYFEMDIQGKSYLHMDEFCSDAFVGEDESGVIPR